MTQFRIFEAAGLLGVSDDTVRRWAEADDLPVARDASNRRVIEGVALVDLARANARVAPEPAGVHGSARNRMVGLVTSVVTDRVMAQVEIQCGPHRIISLMSTDTVDRLELQPGALAVAVVKSTDIIVETPARPRR